MCIVIYVTAAVYLLYTPHGKNKASVIRKYANLKQKQKLYFKKCLIVYYTFFGEGGDCESYPIKLKVFVLNINPRYLCQNIGNITKERDQYRLFLKWVFIKMRGLFKCGKLWRIKFHFLKLSTSALISSKVITSNFHFITVFIFIRIGNK